MQLLTRYVLGPKNSWSQENSVWNRAEAEDKLLINFQSGPVSSEGVNGITPAAVLQIVLDQLRAQHRVPGLRSRARSLVLTKIEEAMHWERDHQEDYNSRAAAETRATAARGGGA